jgi:Fe2+ or Zn2+ uptake regulation protein
VIEFEDCGLEKISAELEARLHVKLSGHLLEFYGLCEACLKAS